MASSVRTDLHGIRDLEGDERICVQAQTAQPAGDRGNHAISLCISQLAGRSVGEDLAVGRIDQRQRVGPPFRVAAEQVIERGTPANARGQVLVMQVGENHDGVILP